MKIVRLLLISCAISLVTSACKVEDISNTLINSESAKATYITGVSVVEADGTYGPGSVIHIHVKFSEDIVIFSGSPSITLNSGNVAVYSNTMFDPQTAIFSYPISAGDNSTDLNYVNINSLNINSALVNNVSSGEPASLVLPDPASGNSIGTNHNIVIDGIAPPAPTVLGVYDGSNDTIVDHILDGGLPTPTIDWVDVSGEAGYDIEVFDHTSTSVCFHSVGPDVTTVDMSVVSCNLQMSREHKIVVSSVDTVGNSADSTDFLFMVSPFPMNGMQLWLDAEDQDSVITTVSNVDVWKDKSGNAIDAFQTNGPMKPQYNLTGINSKPSIQFDGTNDCMKTLANGGMNSDLLSVFLVTQDSYSSGYDKVFNLEYASGAAAGSANMMHFELTPIGISPHRVMGRLNGGGSNSGQIGPTPGHGSRQVVSIIWDGSDQIHTYMNGVSGISISGISAMPSGHLSTHIGCQLIGGTTPNDAYQGYMGEMIVYDRAVSASERINIETFLMSKW